MWIQPLDLDVGGLAGGPAWLRIARDGDLREVHLPARFDAMRFTPSVIWGTQRDELDVASVASIELPDEHLPGDRRRDEVRHIRHCPVGYG